MSNIWIISDTHFGHENIIKYCNRPFKDAFHMDSVMIRRWRGRVKPEDTVYHLGDVMLMARLTDQEIQLFLSQLPGKKILILGNHDKSAERMVQLGFIAAFESAIIQVPQLSGMRVLLNHYPIKNLPESFNRDGQPVKYVLHGHIHNSTEKSRALLTADKGELVHIPEFNINCSTEMWNYEPATIQHIIRTHMARRAGLGPTSA